MKAKLNRYVNFVGESVVRYFVLSVCAGFFWFLLESSFIFVLQIFLVTIGIMSKDDYIFSSMSVFSIKEAVSILIGFGVLRGIGSFLKIYVSSMTQHLFVNTKRKEIVQAGLSSESEINSVETMSMFSEVVYMASSAISQMSNFIISSVSSFLFILYGFYLAPIEMALGLVLLFLLVIPLKSLTADIHKSGEGLVFEWNKINDILLLGLRNNFLLRVYDLIGFEVERSKQVIDKYCDYQKSYARASSFLYSLPVVVGVVIISVITYFSLTLIKTPGTVLLAFFYIFIRIAQSASETFNTFSMIRLNMHGLKKMYSWHLKNYGKAENTLIQSNTSEVISEIVNSLTVKNVSFGYDSSKPILKNLNFSVVKGELALIKGESGSGKSTLLSLILGLSVPQKGEIRLNDENKRLDKERVAYVGPESFLIPGTVRENLLYGNSRSYEDNDIWKVLKLSNVESVVEKMENGLDEYLNEYTQLSTGQKQRIAIARALLRCPDVLIFDEATSNLDADTENEIIKELLKIKNDFITIVISHKNSFDEIANIEIDLNKGLV